jgi:hypothetical protein
MLWIVGGKVIGNVEYCVRRVDKKCCVLCEEA